MTVCAQEEVFGPFVTVLRFSTEEEALAIANGTEYGLGSGLWTRTCSRAHKMAEAINVGMCWINCYKRVSPGSPFGGRRSIRLWPGNGLRSDPRLHRSPLGVGQRRRKNPATFPALRPVMNPFVYQSLPTRVVFGWGKLSALAEEIERLGARRALILTTPEQHGLGEQRRGVAR